MSEAISFIGYLFEGVLTFLRGHFSRELRLTIYALGLGLLFYVVFRVLERVYGRPSSYHTRGFIHDGIYWFYYKSGLDKLIFSFVFFSFLEKPLSFLDIKLLASLSAVLQFCVGLVVADFIGYWYHRASHKIPFLWAFHTTHHSAEHLNFATGYRFHPLDFFFKDLCLYVPLRIMGVSFEMAVPIFLVFSFYAATHHASLPWKFGRLSKILISPVFHMYHHSTDPAHFDKNFSSTIFSFWDYLFGTAVDDNDPLPTRLGLDGIKYDSFVSTITGPFAILSRRHRSSGNQAPPG